MKKITCFLIVVLIAFSGFSCANDEEKAKSIADDYIGDFVSGDYAKMLSDYATVELVASQLNEELLQDVWDKNLIDICGEFVKVDFNSTVTQSSSSGTTFLYSLVFAYQKAFISVGVTPELKINSFLLHGYENVTKKEFAEGIKVQNVAFGDDNFMLNGEFVRQDDGAENIPCVIVFAGSGNIERYGLIGPNAIYFDIAQALAQKGMGVLIFDKRSYTYGAAMGENITVEDEYIEDAYYALEYAKQIEGVDASKIYMLGHSMGGYLLPWIAEATDYQAAGYIFLAANSSSLQDLMLYQIKYIAESDGEVTAAEESQISQIEAMIKNINALTADNYASYDPAVLLNVPASYWLSLKDYDPCKLVKNIAHPMLFINGGRDYQVPPKEADAYKKALSGRSNVTFKLVKDANHIMMIGEGKPLPAEYYTPSHVDEEIIDLIAGFVGE